MWKLSLLNISVWLHKSLSVLVAGQPTPINLSRIVLMVLQVFKLVPPPPLLPPLCPTSKRYRKVIIHTNQVSELSVSKTFSSVWAPASVPWLYCIAVFLVHQYSPQEPSRDNCHRAHLNDYVSLLVSHIRAVSDFPVYLPHVVRCTVLYAVHHLASVARCLFLLLPSRINKQFNTSSEQMALCHTCMPKHITLRMITRRHSGPKV